MVESLFSSSVYLIYDLISNRCMTNTFCIDDSCILKFKVLNVLQSCVRSWVIHFKAITWWHHPESAFCSRRKCNRFLRIISNEIFYPDLIPECYRIFLLLSDVVVRWNTFLVFELLTVNFPWWGTLQWLGFQNSVFVTWLRKLFVHVNLFTDYGCFEIRNILAWIELSVVRWLGTKRTFLIIFMLHTNVFNVIYFLIIV